MMRALIFRFTASLIPAIAAAQAPTPPPNPLLTTAPDSIAYGVAYVDVRPSSRSAAITALKQYRDASMKDHGAVRIDVYEEIGQPGHLVIVERWADASA